MCGIVGAVAERDVTPHPAGGPAGAWSTAATTPPAWPCSTSTAALQRQRAVGQGRRARRRARRPQPLAGHTGIAHTRWATHGAPHERNAHPHICRGDRDRRGPQRHHREPRRPARRAWSPRATTSPPRPTPRSSPTAIHARMAARRRPARGRRASRRRARRRLRPAV
ncbi:MAG: hypothetical protein U5K43_04900 [Halofilum sp. (in: g-proteobacteria)]|nr:hypothetical protein [Halofilum sp. (in: g-proteobacteria)]